MLTKFHCCRGECWGHICELCILLSLLLWLGSCSLRHVSSALQRCCMPIRLVEGQVVTDCVTQVSEATWYNYFLGLYLGHVLSHDFSIFHPAAENLFIKHCSSSHKWASKAASSVNIEWIQNTPTAIRCKNIKILHKWDLSPDLSSEKIYYCPFVKNTEFTFGYLQ